MYVYNVWMGLSFDGRDHCGEAIAEEIFNQECYTRAAGYWNTQPGSVKKRGPSSYSFFPNLHLPVSEGPDVIYIMVTISVYIDISESPSMQIYALLRPVPGGGPTAHTESITIITV
ncbi:hypothetical protein TWF694_009460 [Orbilia ellipsospora]|uniref:Uncharacterized protein n=1 Tax=Orbilia ellipsospora TaxID=2528407 RepID=A0AAV9XDJ6_9PEZI